MLWWCLIMWILFVLKQVARYSVNTAHPYFVNQLFSSVDPYGLIGQWLTDALNPSVYTYEVAPVFTLMEEDVLREMRRVVGWSNGEGDGIFCPGGSIANGYAISCARHYFYPEVKVSDKARYIVWLFCIDKQFGMLYLFSFGILKFMY